MENPFKLLNFRSGRNLPIILQTEMAECGLACLAMVTTFHGHAIDLNTLRQRYPISLRGINLNHLIQMADQMGFNSRPLRLELEEMPQLTTPAILHWNMNHFVVLQKATDKWVFIHDPATGKRQLSYEEVSKHFTGVALELYPTTAFEKKDERQRLPFSVFIRSMVGLKKSLLKILALSISLQLFAIISPFYMQWVVDEAIVSHDSNLLLVLSLGFLFVALIQTGVNALRSYVIMYLSSIMSIQMAANLFRHLLRLPLTYFEKRHIGDIVSRFGSLAKIRELLTTRIIEAIVDGLMAIITLGMMWLYSGVLTVVVLLSVTLYGLIRFAWYQPLKTLTEETIVTGARENSTFMETIRAAQSIKIFGKEGQRQTVWENRYADVLNAGIRISKLGIIYTGINGLLFSLENVIVVYLGAQMVLGNMFSIGMLFAFISYKQQFTTRASELIQKFIDLRMLGLHLERLSDIALTPPEISENIRRTAVSVPMTGALRLENVSFSYAGADRPVFKNMSLTIEAGQSIAIVGPSGCGKTTLMKVMMGLFEPTEGEIWVDGVRLTSQTILSYRAQVTAVMQNDQLLSGSILENICFFDTNPDQVRIEAAAQLAAIHADVMQMPMGYHSLIGDMGTTLSGGQKQRVLLARALYAKPKILFLDEATSHMDILLEKSIAQSIRTLDITRVIVAHRPETIRGADRVLMVTPEGLVEVPQTALPAL